MELWDLYDSERRPLNRTHVRGEAFAEGEYYVCAEIWIRNSKGEFLITKRHPEKKSGNLWEFTGGGTLAGESTKAVRGAGNDGRNRHPSPGIGVAAFCHLPAQELFPGFVSAAKRR